MYNNECAHYLKHATTLSSEVHPYSFERFSFDELA